MRAALLVMVGVVATGCVTLYPAASETPTSAPPTQTAAPTVTAPPVATPTLEPPPATAASPTATAETTAEPTAEPTPEDTPDPNATPEPDAREILGAEVAVFNLSDDTMTVSAWIVEATEEGDLLLSEFELPAGQATVRSVIAIEGVVVPYRIDFSYPSGATAVGGTCTVAVALGDDITFVAVPEGITITKVGDEPATAEDMIIATSPLCDAEAEGPLI